MRKLLFTAALLSSLFYYSQEEKTKDIEEVKMTKKVLQKKSDRLVFDVAASPIVKGNNAFDLLKETPLVSSTDDKNIKISGKSNAVIFINGRKSNMNADALESFLKSMPAENIAKIEVITVPGSEYHVESSDGIINIILKKKLTDGTNGNLRFGNTQAKRNSQNASASINFRKNKLAISSNFNSRNTFRDQQYTLKNGDANFNNTSVGYVRNNDLDLGGYVNVDYDLTEKQNIGLSYNSWYSETKDAQSNLLNTLLYRDDNNVTKTTYNRAVNNMNARDFNNSINLNYEAKLDDKGSKINLNAAYLNFTKAQQNINVTTITDVLGNNISEVGKFRQEIPQNIDNLSTTLDFTKVFKNFTLSTGGNFNKTKTDNDTYLERFHYASQTYIKDINQSNHFVYDEKIGGIYANAEKNFGEKFSAKIGARLEFTDSYGEILKTNINVKRNNTNLLPTVNLNYTINKNNSLSYAFTSRVKRPSFWEINPERVYLTEINYIQNNPFVKASSVYNQELMYMYKNSYFLQISDSYTKDATTQVPLQRTIKNSDGENVKELRYIRTNYGSENNFSVNLGMNKNFFNQIWTANYVLGLQVNSFKGTVDTDPITGEKFAPFHADGSMTTPFLQLSNNIRLSSKKDWFLGVNYFYLGKQRIDLGILDPISSLDFSLKKIWNDFTFAVDFRDVLNTNWITINSIQTDGNYNYIDQNQYNRRFNLSITYNFGNKKLKKARNIDGAANEIKNRTGN